MKRDSVAEQQGDVLENDAWPGEIGDITDQ
jgi:hypothetical protein